MSLKAQTTVEYSFNNPYVYYCSEHECLRISENHDDSILCEGLSRKTINFFIANYIEYVLDQPELKVAFEKAAKNQLVKEDTE